MNKKLEAFLAWFLCYYYSIQVLLKLLLVFVQNGLEAFQVKTRSFPPILRNQRLGTHHFVYLQKQGIKLHYVEKGDRSKPLMVCLHGFPECWLSWRNQLETLSTHFCVVAVDMRGYGESDKPKGLQNYSIDTIVEDIREFIAELTEGKTKCILMAHDWGGIIAWILVEKYPDLFERHICIDGPNIRILHELVYNNWRQFKKSWYVFFFQMKWLPEIAIALKDLKLFAEHLRGSRYKQHRIDAYPDEIIEGYQYYYSQKGAFTPPLNYYRNAVDYEPEKCIGKIKIPCLIIWGEFDAALSVENGVKQMAHCETVDFRVVKKGGHFLQSHNAAEINQLVINYLNKLIDY